MPNTSSITKTKGVLLTRPVAQIDELSELLKSKGYQPILAPMIEISKRDGQFITPSLNVDTHPRHLIISSQNALLHVEEKFNKLLHSIPYVWVMGPSSALLAKNYGYTLAKEPTKGETSEELIEKIKAVDANVNESSSALILKGTQGRGVIDLLLSESGYQAYDLITYESTIPDICIDYRELEKTVNIALFTSLMTLKNAMILLGSEGVNWLKTIPLVLVSQRIVDFALSQGFKKENLYLSHSAFSQDCLALIEEILSKDE